MKQAFGRWHGHQCGNFSAASRLAENSDTVRIASKVNDVSPDPLENDDDVEHPDIGGHCKLVSTNGRKIEIAVHIQTMIVSYDQNIVIARETFAFVGEKIVVAAARESSSMHVDHNRALVRTVNLRCPDVDAQAVFARHKDG